MSEQIDLNCDLGEWRTENGPERDEAIMQFITSCNIACGGHIGDERSMTKTVELAVKHGVKIGAHPSYPDKEHFGRVVQEITEGELRDSLKQQIEALKNILERKGEPLHHIKPHGALYNQSAKNELLARLVMEVIQESAPDIPVYLSPGSVSKIVAEEFGIPVVTEVFADRAYEEDLSLRSRSLKGAVLDNEQAILEQLELMIFQKKVNTWSGKLLSLHPETVCLHSDTPGATALAKSIHQFLESRDVEIVAP